MPLIMLYSGASLVVFFAVKKMRYTEHIIRIMQYTEHIIRIMRYTEHIIRIMHHFARFPIEVISLSEYKSVQFLPPFLRCKSYTFLTHP